MERGVSTSIDVEVSKVTDMGLCKTFRGHEAVFYLLGIKVAAGRISAVRTTSSLVNVDSVQAWFSTKNTDLRTKALICILKTDDSDQLRIFRSGFDNGFGSFRKDWTGETEH